MKATGIKRDFEDPANKACSNSKIQKTGHWSNGLLTSMNDPQLIIEKDDTIVIIKDKYPKANHHFLVIPNEKVPDLKSLKACHVKLLKYMEERARSLTDKYTDEFKYGYHAIPSMSQLHLHVISTDFCSPCLKTKRHWNSFNTKYFINSEDVISGLEEDGTVSTMTSLEAKQQIELPLQCHKCSHKPQNIPKLKLHLVTHAVKQKRK